MPETKLRIADVLAWADEHRRRTGAFPNAASGVVAANPKESWGRIHYALRAGRRGLPSGSTLSQFLAKRRGHRNPTLLPKYTITGIPRWADAYHRKTGKWPINLSGPIDGAPGESWKKVDEALRHGFRGLPGGSSLPKLLERRRSVCNRATPRPRLTIAAILKWIDVYHARTGQWPTVVSGPIQESPGDMWTTIDHALSHGRRGLSCRACDSRPNQSTFRLWNFHSEPRFGFAPFALGSSAISTYHAFLDRFSRRSVTARVN